jgi:hypothetical protein
MLNNMLMQLDHQIHMITHHSPHTVSEITMGHASAASAADKQLIELLGLALRARGVSDLSVRMHGSSAADKPRQHGEGTGKDRTWGGGGAVAAATRKGAADDSDDDDASSADDADGPSNSSRKTYTSARKFVKAIASCNISDISSAELAQPSMDLGFFESTGMSGVLDNLGSCAASCLAYVTVFMTHSIRNPPAQRQPTWWGMAALQRAFRFVRLAMAAGLTLTVALMATLSARFASPEELERLRAVGFLPPQEQQQDAESDDEPSEWEEVDEGEVEEPPEVEMEQMHAPAGQAAGAAAGGVAGAVQAAADALLQAGGVGVGGVQGGGLLGGAPQVNPEFVDQGIQELLNPEGEDKLDADLDGGMTGIPAQVQVVAGLNSAASWSFVAGAVPVGALGVWFGYGRVKWTVVGVFAIARYAFGY